MNHEHFSTTRTNNIFLKGTRITKLYTQKGLFECYSISIVFRTTFPFIKIV